MNTISLRALISRHNHIVDFGVTIEYCLNRRNQAILPQAIATKIRHVGAALYAVGEGNMVTGDLEVSGLDSGCDGVHYCGRCFGKCFGGGFECTFKVVEYSGVAEK